MKAGKYPSLIEMAEELERQKDAKRDFIVESSVMTLDESAQNMNIDSIGEFPINNVARRQLAEKLNIPAVYFDRLQESHPDMLAYNVNNLMRREVGRHMVRTLDGDMRALLSDRYRPLDNYDLADAVLPVLTEAGVQVESCDITDRKMYIKAFAPWLDRELPMPEGYKMGEGHNIWVRKVIGAIVISNSEVGSGALSISPAMFERQCTNLAVFKSEGYGRMHVGKKAQGDDAAFEFLSNDTRKLDDAAVWSRARDMVKATLDGRVVDKIVAKMVDARGDQITGDPVKVVEVFGKKHGLSQDERGGLLRHLTTSGEATRYGLQWAATRLSQDVKDYDRASELERLGGQIIELPKNDWKELAKAA